MANNTLTDFRPYVHPDVQGVDRVILDQNLRFVINEFCEETWLLQKGFTQTVDTEDIDTDLYDSIVISTTSYFPYHRPFAISEFRVNGTQWKLVYLDMVNDTSYLEEIKGNGYKAFHFVSATSMRIAPFSQSDELFIKAVFKPLQNFTYVDEKVFDWVEAIAAGTKSRLLDMPGKPWTNHPASNRWERIYRQKLSKAKRMINKQFTRQSGTVNPQEFGFSGSIYNSNINDWSL